MANLPPSMLHAAIEPDLESLAALLRPALERSLPPFLRPLAELARASGSDPLAALSSTRGPLANLSPASLGVLLAAIRDRLEALELDGMIPESVTPGELNAARAELVEVLE